MPLNDTLTLRYKQEHYNINTSTSVGRLPLHEHAIKIYFVDIEVWMYDFR